MSPRCELVEILTASGSVSFPLSSRLSTMRHTATLCMASRGHVGPSLG